MAQRLKIAALEDRPTTAPPTTGYSMHQFDAAASLGGGGALNLNYFFYVYTAFPILISSCAMTLQVWFLYMHLFPCVHMGAHAS